jgi:hypothetical protein
MVSIQIVYHIPLTHSDSLGTVAVVLGHRVERNRPGFDPGPQVIDIVHSAGAESIGVRWRADEGGRGVGHAAQPRSPGPACAFFVFDLVVADARARPRIAPRPGDRDV